MEGLCMPHGQVSSQEDRTIHRKVPSNLYRNNKLNFLVKFNFVLSTLKRFQVSQILVKDVQGFSNLAVTILSC